MRRATVAVVLLLVSAAGAAAQDSDKGKAVYAAHCQSCHGPEASGGQGPPLVSFDAELSEFTTLVRQGVGLMPAFPRSEISDAQVADLHAYLLSLNKGDIAVRSSGSGGGPGRSGVRALRDRRVIGQKPASSSAAPRR